MRVRTWGRRHGGRETGVIDRILEEDLKLPGKLRLAAKHIFKRLKDEYDFLAGYTIVKECVREHRTGPEKCSCPCLVRLVETSPPHANVVHATYFSHPVDARRRW